MLLKILEGELCMHYLKNKFSFLRGDGDITYKEEFHYIFITLRETFKIIFNRKD